MIASLKSYPEMKNSGVEWLEEVPEHWDVQRLKTASHIQVSSVNREIKEGEKSVKFLGTDTVYGTDYITRNTRLESASASDTEVEKFALRANDVLVTKDSLVPTRIAIPAFVIEDLPELSVCGYHLALLRPVKSSLSSDYLFYALLTPNLSGYFLRLSKGTTIIGLGHGALSCVPFPLPPLPEQTAIVRYLGHFDRRIQRYVRAKQRLIKLLEEQKKVVIQRSVTRGLDPDVPLKPSGVEWLGDIPAHWEVRRLKMSVANVVDLTNHRSKDELYVALEHVESGTGRISESGPDAKFDSQVKRFMAGDILFGKLRPYLTKVARPERSGVCVGEFLVLRPQESTQDANYLKQFLRSKSIIDVISASAFGAKMPRADWMFIGGMKQLLPPLSEQTAIVEYLDKVTADIDAKIAHARRQTDLIREYRARLIADVVTGKLDVREAAAELPDEPDEPEACDNPENMMDNGGALDDTVEGIQ